MALPFTEQQRGDIRRRLYESACRHAVSVGLAKTSLDALTADAGISKSSFYKFFESKEQLFLEAAAGFEQEILAFAARALEQSAGRSDKERASAFVYAAFERVHQLGVARFIREDIPLLRSLISEDDASAHCLSSAQSIFDALRSAHIRFTAPDETVLSVIQIMYLSIMHMGELGERFFPALHTLVDSACARLVA